MMRRHPFLFWLGAFWLLRYFLGRGPRGRYGFRGNGYRRHHYI